MSKKKDCKNECTEEELKCINCNEKHSPYYKKCTAYLEIMKEAIENRKKRISKQNMEKNRIKSHKKQTNGYKHKVFRNRINKHTSPNNHEKTRRRNRKSHNQN